jgi:hypothetical protein
MHYDAWGAQAGGHDGDEPHARRLSRRSAERREVLAMIGTPGSAKLDNV